MRMKRNMSGVDRWVRSAMGIALIYLGPFSDLLTSDPMSGALLAALGVLTLAAGVLAYCPLYQIAGFCTYRPLEAPDDD